MFILLSIITTAIIYSTQNWTILTCKPKFWQKIDFFRQLRMKMALIRVTSFWKATKSNNATLIEYNVINAFKTLGWGGVGWGRTWSTQPMVRMYRFSWWSASAEFDIKASTTVQIVWQKETINLVLFVMDVRKSAQLIRCLLGCQIPLRLSEHFVPVEFNRKRWESLVSSFLCSISSLIDKKEVLNRSSDELPVIPCTGTRLKIQ